MSRSGRIGALLVLLVAVVAAAVPGAAPAGAAPGAGTTAPRRVLIVSLPRLTWDEVDQVRPPVLTRFLGGAAIASMSTRTVGPRTDGADAYLTIGAGNRADALDPLTAGDAADVDESTPSGAAAEVYRRRTGLNPKGEIVVLSIAAQQARNAELLYGSVPGSLAAALRGAGHRMGAVGNADTGLTNAAPQREVALAAMTRTGQVAVGNVSPTLLVADPLAPFGVRTDHSALVASVQQGWSGADVQIVEMSDLERAEEARAESTPRQGDEQYRAALLRADDELGSLLDDVDLSRDLVMVLGPTAPLSAEQLTVFGMRGPGIEPGWARSPTTRRAGFVTLTDVAPTVLDRFDIDPPDSVNDTPIVPVANSTPLDQRIDTMVRDNERALFRDDATGPITVAFIVTLVVLLLAVMWAVGRAAAWKRPLRWCALAVIATPAAIFLSGLVPYGPFSVVSFGLAIATASVVLALVAAAIGRGDAVGPPVLLCLLAVGVLGVDIVTGGNLQLSTVFGYSPIVAGRFAGYGNQAFSILTISALVVVTGGWEIWQRRRPESGNRIRLVVAIVFFGLIVLLDGAPTWGSDVGGVLASIPAFAVCLLLLLGIRIRARLVALIGVSTVGVLVLFAAIDLARPVDSRTHLGRFAQKLLDGDGALILQRKLEANVSILTSTVWTFVIPMALLFIGYLTWRPNRLLRRLEAEHSGFRAFGISGLVLGLVAWAVNDSGVAIPALMLTVALPYTAYLVLALRPADADEALAADASLDGPADDAGTAEPAEPAEPLVPA